MRYMVQEFVAGRWHDIRSFATYYEAIEWSKRYQKARIVKINQ